MRTTLLYAFVATVLLSAIAASSSPLTGSALSHAGLTEVTNAFARRETAAAATFPPPLQDPFYKVPANVSQYKNGQIIRKRSIPTTSFGPDAKSAWQVFYRTTGQGHPDATITTIVVPNKPARGVTKIVAAGMPEDSASLNCATSYTYVAPQISNNTLEIFSQVTPFAALHQGWYVTVPDLEGSKSAFLAGRVEGPAILDGIRATLNFGQAIPNPKTAKIALQGYSGGAHGSGWAAQLASKYAPELNIVGWAAGGLPADIGNNNQYLDGTVYAGFNFLGNAGLGGAWPDYRRFFDKYAKPNTTEVFKRLKTGEICVGQIAPFAFLRFQDSFTLPNISAQPIPRHVYDRELLGKYQPPIKKIPIFIAHSVKDNIVPYPQSKAYADGQCKAGASIDFVSLPAGNHTAVNIAASTSYISVIQDFFDGKRKAGQGCKNGDSLPFAFSTSTNQSQTILGDYAYSILLKEINGSA